MDKRKEIEFKKLNNIKLKKRAIWALELFPVPTSSVWPASEQKDFGDSQKRFE